ncbi:MAG: DUF6348 family protein [Bacteroides sp.]|nr:DUF6348 family protein [Bacteroides sp.]
MKLNVLDESWKRDRVEEYEADPLDPEKALGYVTVALSDMLEIDNRIENGHIFCPDLNMSITPRIGQLAEKNALLNFAMYAPQWGREVFESSVGAAETAKQAVDTAVQSFLFTLVNAVSKMETGGADKADESFATIFAGKTRNWNAYFSDIAAVGEAPDADPHMYWDKLKKPIIKRLGNQKLCYVKIYIARIGGRISVECRVDSIWSEELSMLAAKLAEQWKAESSASHQLFFCIRQDESTVTEYPYFGLEGKALLKEKIKTAVEMFAEATAAENYENLLNNMRDRLGDPTLAIECFAFIPEICAENAYSKVKYAETLEISVDGRKEKTYYKNQLADYWRIHNIMMELLSEGAFGKNTLDIYRAYIEKSAVKNALVQISKKGGTGVVTMSPLQFRFSGDFNVR